MIKKKGLCIIILVIVSMLIHSGASGLFPSMDEMLGTAMPSVGLAVGRVPDEQAETVTGEQETYLNFSGDDYLTFGQYLGGCGATIKEYSSENNTLTAILSARGAEMTFSYDWANRIATVVYPSGTRVETELETADKGDSILPPVGGVMPSAEFAIDRKPDDQSSSKEGLIQTWTVFTDDDYNAFSAYLAETGAVIKDYSIEAGVLNAEIALNGFSFGFVYNWNIQSAEATYPKGTTPETSRWNVSVGSGSILPEIKEYGRELPRISMALKREPSTTEMLEDGSIRETYNDFSEADYNAFSQYLQRTECSLVDYHTEDNGVLIINLTNGSGKMTFSYDASHHAGIAEYPLHNRIEKGWAPTPKPDPAVTPKPDTQIYSFGYSENECYEVAADYLKSVLKNPSSLQIHSYRTITYDDTYCFVFDYSAQNSFGGYTRSNAYIWITKATKSVYFSDFK